MGAYMGSIHEEHTWGVNMGNINRGAYMGSKHEEHK
jgi:hypothetical protein